MLKLVVAFVRNEDFKGQTNDSPAKQRPVSNDNPAIEISLQLCVSMIPTVSATLTTKSTHILAITTAFNGQNLCCFASKTTQQIGMQWQLASNFFCCTASKTTQQL
jgi:hypothetical protein